MHVGAFRIQLQCIAEVHQGALRLRRFTIIFGQREVGIRVAGRGFKRGRQIIFRIALLDYIQIFAITRAIIEPQIARELKVAVHGFAHAFSDCSSAQRVPECCVHLRRGTRKIKSSQARVCTVPNR